MNHAETNPCSDYQKGFIDGLYCYAWMKDGVYYVGQTGKTFKGAAVDVKSHWNYDEPVSQLLAENEKQRALLGECKLIIESKKIAYEEKEWILPPDEELLLQQLKALNDG